jgi:hypothetical protein
MTHVVTINGTHWPAWERADGTLIDFRMFDWQGQLAYLPDQLASAGLPADLIDEAGHSQPRGFILVPPIIAELQTVDLNIAAEVVR